MCMINGLQEKGQSCLQKMQEFKDRIEEAGQRVLVLQPQHAQAKEARDTAKQALRQAKVGVLAIFPIQCSQYW